MENWDEVFYPKDEETKALFSTGKITPHMHLTVIPVVHDKKKLQKNFYIRALDMEFYNKANLILD